MAKLIQAYPLKGAKQRAPPSAQKLANTERKMKGESVTAYLNGKRMAANLFVRVFVLCILCSILKTLRNDHRMHSQEDKIRADFSDSLSALIDRPQCYFSWFGVFGLTGTAAGPAVC